MKVRFRCRLCARKVRIVYLGTKPVPEAREVCPSCWGSKDIPTRRLKAATAAKVRKAKVAAARGERAYARALAAEARAMLERLRRAKKIARKA